MDTPPLTGRPLVRTLVALVVLSCLVVFSSAVAATAAVTTETSHVSGYAVGGVQSGDDGCVRTETYAYTGYDTDAQQQLMYYYSFAYDHCAGVLLDNRYADGVPITLRVDGALSTATLSGTIPLHDAVTGTTAWVAVDETFTGLGKRDHDASTDRYGQSGVNLVVVRSDGVTRGATASGTLGTLSGYISELRSGYVAVTHDQAAA
jgi:hypothetical protein